MFISTVNCSESGLIVFSFAEMYVEARISNKLRVAKILPADFASPDTFHDKFEYAKFNKKCSKHKAVKTNFNGVNKYA